MLKNMNKFFIIIIWLLIACNVSNIKSKPDTIKVGVILPLTGPLSKFGKIEQNSFLMAKDEINASGGINGSKIDLIIEDTKGKPEIAQKAMKKIIEFNKAVVIGGGYTSSETYAAIIVAQELNVPFLINTGSADNITEKDNKYIFRLNQPISEYTESFVSFIKEAGIDLKNAAILHENSKFGQSVAKEFEEICKKTKINITIKEKYNIGTVNFKPILLRIKEKKPDILYLISYIEDATLQMLQSIEVNLNPKIYFGGAAGFIMGEFQKNTGRAAELIYSHAIWTPVIPYKGASEYYNNYKMKFKSETDYHGAEAYAAMQIIADALKRSETFSPEDIRNSLSKTNMITIFGPVKFVSYDSKFQQNRLPTFIVQWQNGVLEIVWPKELATKKFIYPTPLWDTRK